MPLFDEWILAEADTDDAWRPVEHAAIRSILRRRGITDDDAFRRFSAPTLADLHDPSTIHGMGYACERIERAVRDGEPILIYGDYDVDGVTSIVLLQSVLRALGAEAGFVIPHRLVDGYGLKMEVIERVLTEQRVGLIVTVDCGITSIEPVRLAIERGIDVIITDHHLPPGDLPAAAAVLNPKQPGCTYPYKDLAGVGVAFKLCCELIRRSGKKISIESLLKLAAIGTIADVAPLTGENRTIAWLGLRGLSEVRNAGLRALLRRVGIYGRPVRASDIGFKIGPRINAAGRLASANTAIDLFAATDDASAWELCAELDRMNTRRQEIEREVRDQAELEILRQTAARTSDGTDAATLPRFLLLAGEGWHRGVVGLTAGRLAQKYHRPTLVISIDGENCVGSARSNGLVDLHGELEKAADLFTHFGGHEFACGFSLEKRNLPALRERLAISFQELEPALFRRIANVEATLELEELDAGFVAAHDQLDPFGAGNPQPLFLTRGVELRSTRSFAEDCCELTFAKGGATARGVVWPSNKALVPEIEAAGRVDLLFHVEADAYAPQGARLVIVDARPAADGSA